VAVLKPRRLVNVLTRENSMSQSSSEKGSFTRSRHKCVYNIKVYLKRCRYGNEFSGP
jgi:hypothetical protein